MYHQTELRYFHNPSRWRYIKLYFPWVLVIELNRAERMAISRLSIVEAPEVITQLIWTREAASFIPSSSGSAFLTNFLNWFLSTYLTPATSSGWKELGSFCCRRCWNRVDIKMLFFFLLPFLDSWKNTNRTYLCMLNFFAWNRRKQRLTCIQEMESPSQIPNGRHWDFPNLEHASRAPAIFFHFINLIIILAIAYNLYIDVEQISRRGRLHRDLLLLNPNSSPANM